ncbi:hypothetical protein CBM2609_B130128 [Cupriavidus taiwanensis]|uniref:Uncharacterized protein n=1 Tax=Cupriavidus taiwanensis TaxID=164546 RepID=A0A976AZE8_9BURK|nr:hypothetical protein CBM2604_B140122 [Cupriavidus taiwanensis]SOZ31608.1 hypothetical protein CBM2609_B130128 [Cupriavidus taiwanensis]SOZ47536.1 hypothetical protein CBM2610_B110123 [Cupriavidus taiwanensis]SOZ61645.1 hypothetical protein CBM2615_B10034 [Cupriavidus taiwanensis]SOZ65965.1 hypothetical protein CBM2613_B10034 [Cupriavidus taiwanensis]
MFSARLFCGAPAVAREHMQGHLELMGERGGGQFAGGTAAGWRSGEVRGAGLVPKN